MQPHDICYWAIYNQDLVPKDLPFPQIKDKLPSLPANLNSKPKSPEALKKTRFTNFTEAQWQYYSYIYYRQVEMLDADIGRILDALELSGHADNTVIIFTSDHGEGLGHHSRVSKWHPYDESMKVPLIISAPGKIAQNHTDTNHLVSGLDVMATMCDFANIDSPKDSLGLNLRPLFQKENPKWRSSLMADTNFGGRIIRTAQYKYVKYPNDPVEQLFDMKADPLETKNLYEDSNYNEVLKQHRHLMADWHSKMKIVSPSPVIFG